LITAVEKNANQMFYDDYDRDLLSCAGQSVIEFLIVLPLMVGLVMLMTRVNTAIQVSIVNQQYARAQALFISYNSPTYPSLWTRVDASDKLGYNQLIMGMSNEKITDGDDFTEANRQPDAVEITISKKGGGSDDKQAEPDLRSKVHVRTTVTLCSQSNVIRNQGGTYWPILELGPGEKGFQSQSSNRLTEGVAFDYCRAPEGTYNE